jgi:hypothetical protein
MQVVVGAQYWQAAQVLKMRGYSMSFVAVETVLGQVQLLELMLHRIRHSKSSVLEKRTYEEKARCGYHPPLLEVASDYWRLS